MRSILFTFFLLLSVTAFSQTVDIVKFDKVHDLLNSKKSEITVVNFWATWCAPCIKEMPYFEALNKEFEGEVNVYLISLDFADEIEKVNKFVAKKGLKSNLLLLDDIDYNSWIDRVEPSWSGAIPATLILNKTTNERVFFGGEITKEELYESVNKFMKKSE